MRMMRNVLPMAAVLATAMLAFGAGPAPQDSSGALTLPPAATALEGIPRVRVEITPEQVTRRVLDRTEAAASRLSIRIEDGAFYWTSFDGRRLSATAGDGFTYLTSAQPGRYVRVRRVNDRLTYVEHVDMPGGSVTFWGELRVALGR